MKKPIEYYIARVYGRAHLYIADKKIAETISILTGRKVLIPEHKKALEDLGLTFKQIVTPEK